ncbi:MAG: M48 family metalloprotease, partial [Halobacteriaceae archaeon]
SLTSSNSLAARSGCGIWDLFVPISLSDLGEIGTISDQETNPYFFFTVGMATLALWYRLLQFHPDGFIHRFMILFSLILLGYCFSYDLIPGISLGPGWRIFGIPVTALLWSFLSLCLFVIFAFVPGWVLVQAQAITREPVDRSVGSPIIQFTAVTITFVFIIVGFFLLFLALQSRYQLRSLKYIRPVSFDSSILKMVAFFFLFVIHVGIFFSLVPAFSVIFYGIFGTLPFDGIDLVYTQSFAAKVVGVETDVGQIDPQQLVKMSYDLLDSLFGHFSFIPSRVGSIYFFTGMFVPQILLCGFWISELVYLRISKGLILWKSDHTDIELDFLPEDVSVLLLDESDEGSVVAHPVSVLFGWRKYIVVSKLVVEELSEDELEAVLAHESYHIRNGDLEVGALASILSLGFGGKNSLLVFYDFPRIEAEADRFARDQVGLESIVVAIDKLDILVKQSAGKEIPSTSPGFVDLEEVNEYLKSDSLGRNLRRYLNAPSDLLFGDTLLKTAHSNAETRISRLKSSD